MPGSVSIFQEPSFAFIQEECICFAMLCHSSEFVEDAVVHLNVPLVSSGNFSSKGFGHRG
jgi:hypothetical protein